MMCISSKLRTVLVIATGLCLYHGSTSAWADGACCTGQECIQVADEFECGSLGGIYIPDGNCDEDACGVGACCTGTQCVMIDAYSCIAGGRDFMGAGTDCADDPCGLGIGACCLDGECNILSVDDCANIGGTWLGYGTICGGGPCDLGACCLPGDCTDLARHECEDLEGVFLADTVCSAEACEMENECPADSLFSQTRDDEYGFMAYVSEVSVDIRRYDDFSGIPGAIETLRWWGLDLEYLGGPNWGECTEPDPTFEISFHQDAGGYPGLAVCSYTLLVTRTPTGIMYLGTELNEYSVTLPEPCVLVNGWISIVGAGDPDCRFLWVSSGFGSGLSYCEGCAEEWEQDDLSVCLLGSAGGVFGACCDDATGDCESGVEITDCLGEGQRFKHDATCDDLEPPCGVLGGACCFSDGTCSIEQEEDCGALGGFWLGDFTACEYCPCLVACPSESVPEGEPVCGEGYDDRFNGGCDANTVSFSPISFCEEVCGEGGVYYSAGSFEVDYDWYEITVAAPTQLTWTVEAEYPVGGWIIDGRNGCENAYIMTSAAQPECVPVVLTLDVQPGTYWLVAGAASVDEGIVCGSQYTARVTRSGPCSGDIDNDGDVDLSDLAALLGSYGTSSGASYADGDLDCDGDVDLSDLAALLSGYGACGE